MYNRDMEITKLKTICECNHGNISIENLPCLNCNGFLWNVIYWQIWTLTHIHALYTTGTSLLGQCRSPALPQQTPPPPPHGGQFVAFSYNCQLSNCTATLTMTYPPTFFTCVVWIVVRVEKDSAVQIINASKIKCICFRYNIGHHDQFMILG